MEEASVKMEAKGRMILEPRFVNLAVLQVSSLLLAAVRRLHLALSLVVQAVWMAPSADGIANVNKTEKT